MHFKYQESHHASIYWRITDLLPHLDGKLVFVAGNTGFYGSWFMEHLHYLRASGIDVRVFGSSLSQGFDVTDCCTYPPELRCADYVINCAGDSVYARDEHTVGSERLRKNIKPTAVLLHFSSGCVSAGSTSEYARCKALVEGTLWDLPGATKIVRPFASVGPGMGLEKPFAVSAFIRAHLAGEPLLVTSQPCIRSFCHITDLVVQCLHVMVHGDAIPYEVGSDDAISVERAARAISDRVVVTDRPFRSNAAQPHYVADLTRVRMQFNLDVDLDSISAIMDTVRYYAAKSPCPHLSTEFSKSVIGKGFRT